MYSMMCQFSDRTTGHYMGLIMSWNWLIQWGVYRGHI